MSDLRLETEYAEADRALDAAIANGSAEEYGAALARWEKAADAKTWAAPRAKAPASTEASPELGAMLARAAGLQAELEGMARSDPERPAKVEELRVLGLQVAEAKSALPFAHLDDEGLASGILEAKLAAEKAGVDIVELQAKYGPTSETFKAAEAELLGLRTQAGAIAGELRRRQQQAQLVKVRALRAERDAEEAITSGDHLGLIDWKASHRGPEFEYAAMTLERDLKASRPSRIAAKAAELREAYDRDLQASIVRRGARAS